jgi:hypothetical protein
MKNKILITFAVILSVSLICGAFYVFMQNNKPVEKELVENEKVLAKDLEKDYPKTPREVAKFYNRIVMCYHDTTTTGKQLSQLIDQMTLLFDDSISNKDKLEAYRNAVLSDVESYKKENRTIVNTSVCDSNQVRYETDERNGDKLAFVDISYFVKTNDVFSNSYMTVGMREDADGYWKIIGITLNGDYIQEE